MQLTIGIAFVVLVTIGWWSMKPLRNTEAPVGPAELLDAAPAEEAVDQVNALDPSLFAVDLWHVPQAAAAPESPAGPPPQPTLRLELLGISDGGDRLIAWIFDPGDDSIRGVSEGDALGRLSVQQVTGRSVTLNDGSRSHRLVLVEPPTAP